VQQRGAFFESPPEKNQVHGLGVVGRNTKRREKRPKKEKKKIGEKSLVNEAKERG